MVEEMMEKAANASVFNGDIERRQTFCPECGKPSDEGKFCNNWEHPSHSQNTRSVVTRYPLVPNSAENVVQS